MSAEHNDTFFASQFFLKSIIIISKAIFRAKYLIKSCPIRKNFNIFFQIPYTKKCLSLNQIRPLFVK